MPESISVFIVDDHAVVRQGLRAFLEVQPGIDVVGEAANGAEALDRLQVAAPDVVLMDLKMPELDGVETTRQLRAASPATKVIVLTSFMEDEQIFAAIKAGASGYLLKDIQPSDLATAIRQVHRGEAALHPMIAAKLLQSVVAGAPARGAETDALTPREMDVLRQIARGRANKEIALDLGIAQKTVKTHVSNILQKLQLADRTQAALYAVREHLVDPE